MEQAVEGSTVKSHHKVSVAAVQARLVVQYTGRLLLLSEVPVVGQLDWCIKKLVNESILLNKKGVEGGLKEEGLHIVIE